ncbi:MAG TPA: imidazole glycerol phosphate synthase subunit HisH [Mesorhizobium sp.]|jgi:glutamine amidotransferase|uniref:imidazole glycerol phosphate synthase subunit HisH n=1 Tax=Mesorhizobium sp. TaxID=1871066 RepID=UPI002DDCA670|nr:imidazole glycerol phosphate synthase subunit HisH [Mesorhizobium sp.]HEV2503138.1 imidazole glycerol phosphate synthase subunit HisH [Mesorhizobium sp.]
MDTIGLLRMPIGNLQSAWNALYELGFDPEMVDENSDFDGLSHLIVPGVGNFKAVMEHLESKGLPKIIRDFAATGRPTLGICVGMQLLATTGTESGSTEGLGFVNATVDRLPGGKGLPLPHVGWSTVDFRRDHPVTENVKQGRDFYFVHSYAMHCSDEKNVIGLTGYGTDFASIVSADNVVGFQFHPEKSQANGLKLLENFCHWDGTC